MFEFFKRLTSDGNSESRQTGNKNAYVFLAALPDIPGVAEDDNSRPLAGSSMSMASNSNESSTPITRQPKPQFRKQVVPSSSHRERLLAMKVEHLQLCRPTRCQQLADAGVATAGDLMWCDPKKVAENFRSPTRAARAIKRLKAAVRLAVAVEGMMPRDALLLVAIHRRSVASLARESAAQLHRDLERFSLSSQGSRMVGRRGVPSLRRVKSWISACEQLASGWNQTARQNVLQQTGQITAGGVRASAA